MKTVTIERITITAMISAAGFLVRLMSSQITPVRRSRAIWFGPKRLSRAAASVPSSPASVQSRLRSAAAGSHRLAARSSSEKAIAGRLIGWRAALPRAKRPLVVGSVARFI
jgi:hypothetical protein